MARASKATPKRAASPKPGTGDPGAAGGNVARTPGALRDRARRLAGEWRRFGETFAVGAERAEWSALLTDATIMPEPWRTADDEALLWRGESVAIDGKKHDETRIVLPASTSAVDREKAWVRLVTLCRDSCRAVGARIELDGIVEWNKHLFAVAPVEWRGFGGRLGPALVGGGFRRADDPARFGRIDLGTASAEALERIAQAGADRAAELGDGGGGPGDEQPTALSKAARLTLLALDTFSAERLVFVSEIAGAMSPHERLSDKKVGEAIRLELLPHRHAERPGGDRGGARLTTEGRKIAKSLAASD